MMKKSRIIDAVVYLFPSRRMSRRRLGWSAALVAFLLVLPLLASAAEMGAGTEHRDWVTGPKVAPVSPPIYDITEQDGVMVPMRDGVDLYTIIFLPVLPPGAPTPPCVLETNGYSLDLFPLYFKAPLVDLAKRGYPVVHATLRGTPPSEGEANLYNKFGEDGYDLVEWMAQQPWCNGNVGMVGGSLLGISQWLAAKEEPPHLKAITPDVSCGDCYWTVWYLGGMLPGPRRMARPFPEYPSAIEHRNFDAWWRERSTLAEDVEAIARRGVAVMVRDAWNDYLLAGDVTADEELPSARGDKRKLILGSVSHAPAPECLPYTNVEYQVLWLDRWLKGVHNGVDTEPRVLIYVEGPNQWRFEHDWPIPDTHPARLYLRSWVSGTGVSLNDGTLSDQKPGANNAPVSYDYSPLGPFNNANGNGPRLTEDQRPDEEYSLTWTTEALRVPTEATGWWHLTFWAAATATDTDFVVEITDVAPDGMSKQIGRGWLNAPRYFSRSDPELLVPGQIYKYTVEIWPTSYVFPAGHRIRVALSGSDSAGTAPNPNPATVTVYQDASHPSHLDIPIIGATARQSLLGQPAGAGKAP
jgi:predicted acyl esterase